MLLRLLIWITLNQAPLYTVVQKRVPTLLSGSRPSRQAVVMILATKPKASSFLETVILLCNFTDEDKKPEIVITPLGVLQGVDNIPRVSRDPGHAHLGDSWPCNAVS